MRPRERDDVTASPEPSPPPRIAGTLPSMVVRLSESGGGSDSDAADAVDANQSPDPRRRDSPTPSHHRASSPHFRRRVSPPPFRRRSPPAVRFLGSSPGVPGSPPDVRVRGSPPGMHRRGSPPGFPRRYSPPAFRRRGSPPNFNGRFQRFKDVSGYGFHGRSNSPPRRERLDDTRYSPDIDRSAGSQFGRGFRGRGKVGRFREISPLRGRGRGGRSFGRGYNSPGRSLSPVEDVHRHDPNISPREGDWICRNPSCGNLNYAQRSYCSNCNQNRFAPDQSRYSRSPRRGYYNSPPPYMSPEPPIDRGRRNTNGYRAPLRLGADDPRDFRSDSPPSRPGNGFLPYQAQRERVAYRDDEYRERGKFYSPVREEWDSGDRQRDGPLRGRRGYEQRPRSPSPRGRWEHDSRKRSRSPFDEGLVKRSYMGRGRAGRHYNDGYAGRGRDDMGRGRDDMDAGRGRGFRRGRGFQRGDDDFAGDRPGMPRGRNNGVY